MEFIFAYAAGLLTLINPCVLPIIPIVITSAAQKARFGPLALALGMGLSFVVLGMFVTTLGFAVGLNEDSLSRFGAWLMVIFGVVLLVPPLSDAFSRLASRFSSRADRALDDSNQQGLAGQFIGGLLLGAVWSPCIGPTLGGAIALASQGESLLRAGLIMAAFALGVMTLILALAYGLKATALRRFADLSKPILGAVFLAVGLAILFRLHHMIETWAVQNLPIWLLDLSVAI